MVNAGKILDYYRNPKESLEQTGMYAMGVCTLFVKLLKQSGLRSYVKIKEPFLSPKNFIK